MTINPKLTRAEKHELVSAVLGSAFESCPWWDAVLFATGYDWDTLPDDDDEEFVKVFSDAPEGDGAFFTLLSVNSIVKAYFSANLPVPDEYEDMDVDANEGDLVIQHAVYGTAVFG